MTVNKVRRGVCILSFSPVYRDARVLRQIKYLSTYYDLHIIGYGDPCKERNHDQGIQWHPLAKPEKNIVKKILHAALLLSGRITPRLIEYAYWSEPQHMKALELICMSGCSAIHANDLEALPLAAVAARQLGCLLVYDAHEYSPLEFESSPIWRLLQTHHIRYFLNRYGPMVDASMTVAPLIAKRYRDEWQLDPIVVRNISELVDVKDHFVDPRQIRLIHHGGANRERKLEAMIETLSLCDERFHLDFMLVGNEKYIKQLQVLSERMAPGKITFRPPVPPDRIVRVIAEYDVGIYILSPDIYNCYVSLPNKLFDFIMAGLAVIIGPSPSMAEIVHQYNLGRVAPSFKPADVAKMLDRLSAEQIEEMRRAARSASKTLNADNEMQKVIDLYDRLFQNLLRG